MLGYTPIIVTDALCQGYFEPEGFPVLYLPLDADEALCESLLDQYRPVLFLALERCGINAEGDYQNMSGASIRAYTAPVDQMFARAQGRMLTIGVGDGGNEIGMGNPGGGHFRYARPGSLPRGRRSSRDRHGIQLGRIWPCRLPGAIEPGGICCRPSRKYTRFSSARWRWAAWMASPANASPRKTATTSPPRAKSSRRFPGRSNRDFSMIFWGCLIQRGSPKKFFQSPRYSPMASMAPHCDCAAACSASAVSVVSSRYS